MQAQTGCCQLIPHLWNIQRDSIASNWLAPPPTQHLCQFAEHLEATHSDEVRTKEPCQGGATERDPLWVTSQTRGGGHTDTRKMCRISVHHGVHEHTYMAAGILHGVDFQRGWLLGKGSGTLQEVPALCPKVSLHPTQVSGTIIRSWISILLGLDV